MALQQNEGLSSVPTGRFPWGRPMSGLGQQMFLCKSVAAVTCGFLYESEVQT